LVIGIERKSPVVLPDAGLQFDFVDNTAPTAKSPTMTYSAPDRDSISMTDSPQVASRVLFVTTGSRANATLNIPEILPTTTGCAGALAPRARKPLTEKEKGAATANSKRPDRSRCSATDEAFHTMAISVV